MVVYFNADPATDHKLKWDMFALSKLEGFDGMLNRVYKQELGAIVGRYEKYRRALNFEITQRLQEFRLRMAAGEPVGSGPGSS